MILGKRLRFRAIEKADLSLMVKWRNEYEVNRYFYEHEPLSLVMQEKWFERYLNSISNEKVWIVDEIDTSNPIGSVSIYHIDWRSRRCEWGRLYLVGDFRGKGYGKEIEKMIYTYVFEHLNMNKLECEVYSDNVNVIELHKKMGSRVEGELVNHVYREGRYKNVTRMAILYDEYIGLKNSGLYEL